MSMCPSYMCYRGLAEWCRECSFKQAEECFAASAESTAIANGIPPLSKCPDCHSDVVLSERYPAEGGRPVRVVQCSSGRCKWQMNPAAHPNCCPDYSKEAHTEECNGQPFNDVDA